jgi:hypothetical protein
MRQVGRLEMGVTVLPHLFLEVLQPMPVVAAVDHAAAPEEAQGQEAVAQEARVLLEQREPQIPAAVVVVALCLGQPLTQAVQAAPVS